LSAGVSESGRFDDIVLGCDVLTVLTEDGLIRPRHVANAVLIVIMRSDVLEKLKVSNG
jgi:hypothetical protein